MFRSSSRKKSGNNGIPSGDSSTHRKSSSASSDLQCSLYVCERVSKKKVRSRHVDVDFGPPEANKGDVFRRLSISESIRTLRVEYGNSSTFDPTAQHESGPSPSTTRTSRSHSDPGSTLRWRNIRRSSGLRDLAAPQVENEPGLSPVQEYTSLPQNPSVPSPSLDYIPLMGCCGTRQMSLSFPGGFWRLSTKIEKKKPEKSILMTRHNTGNNRASNRRVLRLRRSRASNGREDTRSSTMPLLGSRQGSRLGRSDTMTSRAGVESPTSESPGVTFLESNVRSTSPEQEGIRRCSTDDPLTTGQVVSFYLPAVIQLTHVPRRFPSQRRRMLSEPLKIVKDHQ